MNNLKKIIFSEVPPAIEKLTSELQRRTGLRTSFSVRHVNGTQRHLDRDGNLILETSVPISFYLVHFEGMAHKIEFSMSENAILLFTSHPSQVGYFDCCFLDIILSLGGMAKTPLLPIPPYVKYTYSEAKNQDGFVA